MVSNEGSRLFGMKTVSALKSHETGTFLGSGIKRYIHMIREYLYLK